jgi:endo-1,4-beta-xylanase
VRELAAPQAEPQALPELFVGGNLKTMKKLLLVLSLFLLLIPAGCGNGGGGGGSYEFQLEGEPLKEIYENDFLIGNVINETYMTGNYSALLKYHYNTVTCENDMKPSSLVTSQGSYTWINADRQVKFALDNGMEVHGHTLVWHRQTPSWMYSSNAETNMKKHITDVMTYFKGRVKSWDVVNEAVKGFSSRDPLPTQWDASYLRTERVDENNPENPWQKYVGNDYVEIAFKAAKAADPDALLYYNDFDMHVRNKSKAVYYLIKEINDRYAAENSGAKLIDGVGLQGHWGDFLNDKDGMGINTYFENAKIAIEDFISLGIYIDISEMDIRIGGAVEGKNSNSTMSQADAQKQAALYAQVFKMLLEFKESEAFPGQIRRVTFWGLDDKNSWLSKGNPCLFDGNLRPKSAFWAVSDPDSF